MKEEKDETNLSKEDLGVKASKKRKFDEAELDVTEDSSNKAPRIHDEMEEEADELFS